ncbi:hypothetical protein BDP27DRAFT_1370066 [Rhodocollybia butyracea]|uniref:Uncharacterized protein n=1 Tax=Rhodocollybia butyracea TaxID=206335 RepID=A0A9P5TYY8_9AGAR|nr:hypothetical protein BDP27DRAFT_1370066 [Rhodocollybia butyracea]
MKDVFIASNLLRRKFGVPSDALMFRGGRHVISDALTKTPHTYSMVFLICAHISYRGSVADAIISALREVGNKEISRAHEISKLDVVRRMVDDHSTQDRHNIKKKLDGSNKHNPATSNIALLARALIGRFGIPLTRELLSRLVVLSFKEHPNIGDEAFWLTVDMDTDEWPSPGGLNNSNAAGTWHDVEMYGSAGVAVWQVVASTTTSDNTRTIVEKGDDENSDAK